MPSSLYLPGLQRLIDVGLDTIKTRARILLLKDSPAYSFLQTHQYVSSVSGSECNASGYARKAATGDFTIASQQDSGNSRVELVVSGPSLVFASLGAGNNIAAVVLYDHVGAPDASNPLIAFWEITPVIPTNGQNFTLTFDSSDGNIRIARS